MAETLGLVSSCLTIIELSAKIVGCCVEYSTSVKNAAADIQRLQRQVEALQVIVQAHRNLLEGRNGAKLSVSNNVRQAVDACCGHLFRVHEKLKPRKRHSARNLLGIRSLTWPFSSSEVVKLISDIQSWMDIMDAGLQIDQWYIAPPILLCTLQSHSNVFPAPSFSIPINRWSSPSSPQPQAHLTTRTRMNTLQDATPKPGSTFSSKYANGLKILRQNHCTG